MPVLAELNHRVFLGQWSQSYSSMVATVCATCWLSYTWVLSSCTYPDIMAISTLALASDCSLLARKPPRQTSSFQLCSHLYLVPPCQEQSPRLLPAQSCLQQASCTYLSPSLSSTDALHHVYKEIWNKNKKKSQHKHQPYVKPPVTPTFSLFSTKPPRSLLSRLCLHFSNTCCSSRWDHHVLHAHLALGVSSSP